MNHSENMKRPRLSENITVDEKRISACLAGVVAVISGIENPQRAEIKNKLIELGAAYKEAWTSDCTHLISAFSNTPKYKQAIATKGIIVKPEWVEACYKNIEWKDESSYILGKEAARNIPIVKQRIQEELCKKLKQDKTEEEQGRNALKKQKSEIITSSSRSNSLEKYDESEFVDEDLLNRGLRLVAKVPNAESANNSSGKVDSSSDHADNPKKEVWDTLPSFLSGVNISISDAGIDQKLRKEIERYSVAYGAVVSPDAFPNETTTHYIVGSPSVISSATNPKYKTVNYKWIWACHNLQRKV